MQIKLGDDTIRLRLDGGEAETLLHRGQFQTSLAWISGARLTVQLILSADAIRPRVRTENLELNVLLPLAEFQQLLELAGRRDVSINWIEKNLAEGDQHWIVEVDAFSAHRKNKKDRMSQELLI